jgi:hypothetical protein
MPQAAEAPVSSLGGRGLSIVAHLCDAWGVRSDELGLTVWAVLRAPRYPDGSDADGPDLAPEQVSASSRTVVNDGMRSSACDA